MAVLDLVFQDANLLSRQIRCVFTVAIQTKHRGTLEPQQKTTDLIILHEST